MSNQQLLLVLLLMIDYTKENLMMSVNRVGALVNRGPGFGSNIFAAVDHEVSGIRRRLPAISNAIACACSTPAVQPSEPVGALKAELCGGARRPCSQNTACAEKTAEKNNFTVPPQGWGRAAPKLRRNVRPRPFLSNVSRNSPLFGLSGASRFFLLPNVSQN